MATETLNLTGWRNAPFPADTYVWALDSEEATVIDLTDKTFALDVRAVPGTGTALVSLDMAASSSADGIWVIDAAGGEFRIQIGQAAMQSAWDAAYAAGLMKAGEAAPLVYDLLSTDDDGFTEAVCEGTFTINAGVTL